MLFSDAISLQKLHIGDIETWVDFAYHYSPELFKRQFKSVGVLIEDKSDLDALVKLHNTGGDRNGELKTKDGKAVRFNALKVIQSLPIDKALMKRKFARTADLHLVKLEK